jgi:hypothetical protein
MHTIVYPRYTLVERIIIGLLSLITWPLQWIVGKTREKIRELDIEEWEK